MPRVLVIGLGGTIAMGRGTDGVVPDLDVAQLLAVPGLAETGIDVAVTDLRKVPSSSLTFDDLEAVLAVVADHLGGRLDGTDPVDGVVVTQGTDTIEETAFHFDIRHDRPEPLVVTGAMRNPTLAGADGPANLLAAVQVAADPAARDRGCLVVFADEVHAAARVLKTHSSSIATFQSPDGGPLGYVVEGRAELVNDAIGRWTAPPPRPAAAATTTTTPAPRVALVTTTLGDDATLVDGLADRCDGVVVAGFGVGHVPAVLVEPLEALADRVPVVLASRPGVGPVLVATYGFSGSGTDLLRRGLVSAGRLHPYKARVLLRALLAAGSSRADVAAAFGSAVP